MCTALAVALCALAAQGVDALSVGKPGAKPMNVKPVYPGDLDKEIEAVLDTFDPLGAMPVPAMPQMPAAGTVAQAIGTCHQLTPLKKVNLKKYMSAPWYAQKQQPQWYQPVTDLKCVSARYEPLKKGSAGLNNGWEIDVINKAQTLVSGGDTAGDDLCAKQVEGGKLAVAPCFLSSDAGGDYWILAYDEKKGMVIVSGGQPDVPTRLGSKGQQLCSWAGALTNKGLWLMTRAQNPDPKLVEEMVVMAEGMGIDVGLLLPVDQTHCAHPPDASDYYYHP